MTGVELMAYRLALRSGTLNQVRKTLYEIIDVEETIPPELMEDVLGALNKQDSRGASRLAWPIIKLISKTAKSWAVILGKDPIFFD